MPKNLKHLDKMRDEFRNRVVFNGGYYITVRSKYGIKDTYIVENRRVSIMWHSTPSAGNVLKFRRSDLNRLSRKLGIDEDWKQYSNENTIHMMPGFMSDTF